MHLNIIDMQVKDLTWFDLIWIILERNRQSDTHLLRISRPKSTVINF